MHTRTHNYRVNTHTHTQGQTMMDRTLIITFGFQCCELQLYSFMVKSIQLSFSYQFIKDRKFNTLLMIEYGAPCCSHCNARLWNTCVCLHACRHMHTDKVKQKYTQTQKRTQAHTHKRKKPARTETGHW